MFDSWVKTIFSKHEEEKDEIFPAVGHQYTILYYV